MNHPHPTHLPIMETSKTAHHAILFTKEGCPPCEATKEFCFALKPGLMKNFSLMRKENHSALVAAYDLNLYPTLLVVDENGAQLDRYVGGRVVRDNLVNILNTINANRNE